MNAGLTNEEHRRYLRHIALDEVGVRGQERLKSSKILLIGAGGLGSPAALYLAAAGVGTIGIVDDDEIEISNLQRQILFGTSQQGASKVKSAAQRLSDLNPHVKVEALSTRLTAANALEIFRNYDLIIDGSDNFGTKYLVNDACVLLQKPFISGSILRFEGQLSLFNTKAKDGSRGPTYRCLFPAPPQPGSSPACEEIGVLGILPGVVGTLQATEAIKYLLEIGDSLSGKLLIYNALKTDFRILHFVRDELQANITELRQQSEYDHHCNQDTSMTVRQLTVRELKEKLDAGEDLQLIDIREPREREIADIGGDLIPMGEFKARLSEVSRDKPVVLYCRSGTRTQFMIADLQKEFGLENLWNLKGGILAWQEEIDPSLRRY